MAKMKWTAELYSIELDSELYMKVLLNTLRNANERAGKAWIQAAANQTPIPTWSGASRGTFIKLAKQLGTSIAIGPIRKGVKKAVNLGVYSASASGVVEKRTKGELYIGFVYDTVLRHLAYNEYNSPVAGKYPKPFSNKVRYTPYRFQSRAEAAWQVEASKVKLPNPYTYLKKRKL